METREMALNLATRDEYVPVSRCKFCDERIAWTASKRTGKRYPCTVVHSQSDENWQDQYRFAPWKPHKCR